MMKIGSPVAMLARVLTVGLMTVDVMADEDFYDYWGDGRAELSSYRVTQPRYGETHEGHSVMIFVTEEINRQSLIKVESNQPQQERVYTLKLNKTLKFLTGIYPYSVMTSVFSAVEGGPSEPGSPFEARKVTLSAQEWCGHVFEEVQLRDDAIFGDLNSYFEREGKQGWRFDRPDRFVSEDHLPIEIRELKGLFMASGETRTVQMLPELWQFRMQHKPRALVKATIRKGAPESIDLDGTTYSAIPWTWDYLNREVTMWVDAAYPHRILQWRDNDGGEGQLLASMRLPYWQLNDLGHESYRQQLKLQ
ncbi:MAG: hypothetical protein QF768_12025 [Candidatus Latescibacteria bacterium]|jgi:hypothetical protein|nr:hypothetical protein [Candidatus Latescibacterota bacterium]|tara:strand:- start:3790 stop:4707 length:918 start_codon:yes stop_codon:yes gene_type:complete